MGCFTANNYVVIMSNIRSSERLLEELGKAGVLIWREGLEQ